MSPSRKSQEMLMEEIRASKEAETTEELLLCQVKVDPTHLSVRA